MTFSPCRISSGTFGNELHCRTASALQSLPPSSHRQAGWIYLLHRVASRQCSMERDVSSAHEPRLPPASTARTSQSGMVCKSIRVSYSTRQKPKSKWCHRGRVWLLLPTVSIPGRQNKKQLDFKVPDLVRETGHQKYVLLGHKETFIAFFSFFLSFFFSFRRIIYKL